MSAALPVQTAQEAYRLACMRRLAAAPFTPDRLGLYALRLHEKYPGQLGVLYVLDRENRLLRTHVLYSGRRADARAYCPLLAGFLMSEGSRLALSVTTEDDALTEEDVIYLSRTALFCEQKQLPVFEMILVSRGEYYPLLRRSGVESMNI